MGSTNDSFTLEQFQELANLWSPEGDAISVYFQPPAPTELAHRDEPIRAKDDLRQKLSALQGTGPGNRTDMQRILDTVAVMKGNEGRSKIIFSCAQQNFWREYDLRGDFGIRIDVAEAFSIAPLIAQQQGRRRYCIALADRNKARLLLLESREIAEYSQVLDEEKEKIRTTGTAKSVHLERQKEEQVRRHFVFLAEHLLHFHEHGDFDGLLIGCRDEMWPEIEAVLHPQIKRVLVGQFSVDPGLATSEQVLERAQELIDEKDKREEQDLLERALGGAAAGRLGAVGLEPVLNALEKGEVWTLLWPGARGVEGGQSLSAVLLCPNCSHLSAGTGRACELCGTEMRRFSPPEEALLRHSLGRNIEVRTISHEKLPPSAEIAATLRFVAEQNTGQKLAS